jgi:hypothetical protein
MKNRTPTELVNTMLEIEGLSKKRLNLGVVWPRCANQQEAQAWIKIVYHVLFGYAIHNMEVLNNKLWSTWHACWYNLVI